MITSRREPDLKAIDRATLYPELLTGERLIPFIFEYLRRRKLDHLLPPRQQVQLGERVLALAESGGRSTCVTPLLVTLLDRKRDQPGAHRGRSGQACRTKSPRYSWIMFDGSTRQQEIRTGIAPNEELIHAACCLAIASLGDNFIPSDFQQEDGLKAITATEWYQYASRQR